MSREFPFINEDAEGIRDGNRAIEKKLRAEICNKDYIQTFNRQSCLALDGNYVRYSCETPQEELWHLSSIFHFEDSGVNRVK